MDRISKPWSVSVAAEDVPESGGHYELSADAAARDGVAKITGLRSLPRLEAVFDVTRRGAGLRVSGQVTATVGQNCVVTLEPIEIDIVEAVDITFAPSIGDTDDKSGPIAKGKEPPEPLLDGTVDLGALATEFLILGIDPYPRKAGVEFVTPKADDPAARPFAGLEALKKRPGNKLK